MSKKLLIFALSLCITLVASFGGLMLGDGQWMVLNMMKCEDPDQYDIIFEISRKKINRTHDCFTMTADLDRELNMTYGLEIDVYQKVDGGFKFHQTMSDDCACNFVMKYAKENLHRALSSANIDPPECPIPPGPLRVIDFVMDYTELPAKGVYGTYRVDVHYIYKGVTVGCLQVLLNFDEKNSQRDDDDDDDDK